MSIMDLDSLLDKLHEQFQNGEPTLVTVERVGSGDTLTIGLGAKVSVLSFVRADKMPPYYTSGGGSDVEEYIVFRLDGQWSEFPRRAAVPINDARSAMRFFCEVGELSSSIVWEQV